MWLNRYIRLMISILVILLASDVLVQGQLPKGKFDSLYKTVICCFENDSGQTGQYLKKLTSDTRLLSPTQRARLNYLVLRYFYAHKGSNNTIERNLEPVAGTPGYTDSLQHVAHHYLERSMPDRAIPLLMNALKILAESSPGMDHVKIELCEAYRQKQEYQKGIHILYSLLERKDSLSQTNLALAWNRMAALYNEWGTPSGSYPDSVIRYSMLCMQLSERSGDLSNLAAAQNELSFRYRKRQEYDRALELSQKAVSNFLKINKPFQAMNVLINQSCCYVGKRDYVAARHSLEEATMLSPVLSNPNLYMRIYRQYASVSALTGNFQEAYEFMEICNDLQTEFFKDRINTQIIEQSARYDLLVKEQQISEEQKKNEFNQRQIILLGFISLTLIVMLIFSVFYFRLKRQGAMKQKLIEAVVETETNERRRIARDLHDGLGPVLSAINHYFQAYLDVKPENREAIQTRLQMVITEAINEVSRISHNISPHVLEKHGLLTALNNLFAPLTANDKYEINFRNNLDVNLDPKLELTIYRCITELLNNTMKHARATRITLEVKQSDGKLMIWYADNGIGLNPDTDKKNGMGLFNIANRVESYGGTLKFDSHPGSGTSVNITIPL